MVLCAGHGTRLGPLSRWWPKPLLPLGDRPMLANIAETLRRQGFSQLVINTHHLSERFSGLALPLAVNTVFEAELRGTAGGIAHARQLLAAPLLVWNGDIAAEPLVEPLLSSAQSHGVCLLAAPAKEGDTGTLGLDAVGDVVRLRGEQFGQELRAANYVGILALDEALLNTLPDFGCLMADVLLPRLRRGQRVATLPYLGAWTDMGNPDAYHALNMDWLAARGLGAHVHPSVRVGSEVTVQQSLLHQGAVVTGAGALTRVIALPAAQVSAPLSDAIALPGGEIVRLPYVRA
jgi:mannose-1-phosphate guanylyltransferase